LAGRGLSPKRTDPQRVGAAIRGEFPIFETATYLNSCSQGALSHRVREAVEGRVTSGREMDRHYDHPILMLQHLIWHEGYHHGQIKLTLKLAGRPIADDEAGPGTWATWMEKTR